MRRIAAALVVALCLALVAGCAPTPAATLPEDVTVGVRQNRDDYGPRRIEVLVTNDGTEALEVRSARLDSSAFALPSESTRPTTIRPGTTTAVRLDLGPPDCDGAGAVETTVQLDFETAGGGGTAVVTPEDALGTLERVHAEDCLAEQVAAIVDIVPAGGIEIVDAGDGPVAHLVVTVTPTGADGAVTISAVDRTILLRPASGGGAWPVEARLDAASEALSIDLAIVPANCSTHTVAEDKRGTFLPVVVALDSGASGVVSVGVDDTVRAALYRYIADDYCGW